MLFVFILVALPAAVVCPGGAANHEECNRQCYEALGHLDWSYNEHICHEIDDLNCHHLHIHLHEGDVPIVVEQLCGTDGVTYESHCEFAVQRCEYLFGHHRQIPEIVLDVYNHGPCHKTTTQAPVTKTSTLPTSTMAPVIASSTMNVTKPTAPMTTTSVKSSTTPATTTISMHDLMAGVFCRNKDAISCNVMLTIVCASNGQFYPNMCELSKAACSDPTLHPAADASPCTAAG